MTVNICSEHENRSLSLSHEKDRRPVGGGGQEGGGRLVTEPSASAAVTLPDPRACLPYRLLM